MSRRTAIQLERHFAGTKLQGYGRTFCHRLAGADGGAGHPAKPQRPHYAHSRHGAGRQFLRDAATIIHHGRLGTSTLQVVWENYPNETPVISGGMHITNWTHGSGNEWQATLPSSAQYFEQLFYNGQRRLRPRLGGSLGTYYRVAATIYLPGSASGPAPDPNCTVYMSGLGWECFDRFQYTPRTRLAAAGRI